MVVVSSTFTAPIEGILQEVQHIKLLVNDQELGTATLYVTEHNVVWGGGKCVDGTPSPTVSLLYPSISLHAVQREPIPALYVVLNYELRLPGYLVEDHTDDNETFDADSHPISQLRFIPLNETELVPLYNALKQGQVLHPDPSDEVDDDHYMDGEDDDDDDDADEEFEDAEEANGSAEEAAARLRQMRLENSNGPQFEDCDDAEEAEE